LGAIRDAELLASHDEPTVLALAGEEGASVSERDDETVSAFVYDRLAAPIVEIEDGLFALLDV